MALLSFVAGYPGGDLDGFSFGVKRLMVGGRACARKKSSMLAVTSVRAPGPYHPSSR